MPGPDFTIRNASEDDIEGILDIEIDGAAAWTLDLYREEIGRKDCVFLVAESGSSIAGFAVAWVVLDETQLHNIAVKRNFRKNGIGSALMDNVSSESKLRGSKKIHLEVREKNSSALSFYMKKSFSRVGFRKNFYGDDNAILMEKTIE